MSFWVRREPERGSLEPSSGIGQWQGPVSRGPALRRGLYTFLLPLASLFGLVIMAYVMRRHMPDWQPVTLPWQVWFSTVLLVASSLAFEQARKAARLARLPALRRAVLSAGVLALAFLGSQLWAWTDLQQQEGYLAANPSYSFFYLMTGLHALHLLGGLVAWSRLRMASRIGPDGAALQLSIQLCAIYWHFLLAVWLVLLGVLIVMR